MLSERVQGYWDRADVEIDLVAISEDDRKIRFGTCKRNPDKLPASARPLMQSAKRFLSTHRRFADWKLEYVGFAPTIDQRCRKQLSDLGMLAQDLADLTMGL